MQNEYAPSEDMQEILDFLGSECHYKEREKDYVADAKDLLERVGWVFDERSPSSKDVNLEIWFYNKYQEIPKGEENKWCDKWLFCNDTDKSWTRAVVHCVQMHKNKMLYRNTFELQMMKSEMIQDIRATINKYDKL